MDRTAVSQWTYVYWEKHYSSAFQWRVIL